MKERDAGGVRHCAQPPGVAGGRRYEGPELNWRARHPGVPRLKKPARAFSLGDVMLNERGGGARWELRSL